MERFVTGMERQLASLDLTHVLCESPPSYISYINNALIFAPHLHR